MPVKYSEEPQGTDLWLQERVGLLTASRFAKAMGKGKGREDLLHELRFQRRVGALNQDYSGGEEQYKPAAMARGNRLEPEARLVAGILIGEPIREVGLAINDDHPGIGASLDGLIGDDVGLEIKCPMATAHDRYLKEARVPPAYKWQIVGQQLVCDLRKTFFFSYHPADPCQLLLEVERNEDDIEQLKEGLRQFFFDLEQLESN